MLPFLRLGGPRQEELHAPLLHLIEILPPEKRKTDNGGGQRANYHGSDAEDSGPPACQPERGPFSAAVHLESQKQPDNQTKFRQQLCETLKGGDVCRSSEPSLPHSSKLIDPNISEHCELLF